MVSTQAQILLNFYFWIYDLDQLLLHRMSVAKICSFVSLSTYRQLEHALSYENLLTTCSLLRTKLETRATHFHVFVRRSLKHTLFPLQKAEVNIFVF